MTDKLQNIIHISLLILLLAVQLFWVFRNQNKKRRWLKLALNLFLWASLVVLIFPPRLKSAETLDKIGIRDANITDGFLKNMKDSLGLKKIVSPAQYLKEYEDKNLKVYLLGQSFDAEFLSNFSDKKVEFFPEFKQNEIQNINWRAVLYQNETQEIDGYIDVEKPALIGLKFGNQTLDSIKLNKGKQHFSMSFPSFSIGKTSVKLTLDGSNLMDLNYYSRTAPKLKVLFLADSPDFETKMLSEWLGKNGHEVDVETMVTKTTTNKVNINKTKTANYNLVFTTPDRVNNAICRQTLNSGGGVFVYNVQEGDLPNINKNLGDSFVLQRISSETETKLSNDLVSIPFGFKDNKNQQKLKPWPVAISNRHVGVTLISETYPLLLSGDSINYRKIWGGVLQLLQPTLRNNIEVQAPVLENLFTSFRFNNFNDNPGLFKISKDTIFLKNSPINLKETVGSYVFRSTGWQEINDSLEVFVNKTEQPSALFKQTKSILKSYKPNGNDGSVQTNTSNQILPDWLRLLLCIIFFVLLWVEAKW